MGNYTYEKITPKNIFFKKICSICENDIVLPNHSTNGGTLNYTHLTYSSDILIVCKSGRTIIGFNSLVVQQGQVYIYQIAVRPEFKNQGIGTKMMEMAVELAKENGMLVTAHVMDYNEYSQKMMAAVGLERLAEYSAEGNSFYMLDPLQKEQEKDPEGKAVGGLK